MIKKTIALIVALSFVFSNIVFAGTPKNTGLDAKKQVEITTDPEKIVVPRDYGLVKSRYIAKDSKKLVIHIQDAHCNYEAQSNIIKILECLIKNDGLGLISVEGADGFIDTSWFKAFPDADIRKEVADYFMKKGEITGPEFLSITSDYPVKLFGAETRSYYIENLNAFTSSYPLKEDTEKYFNQIKAVLNKLKNYIYSDELKELDTKSQDYESKKLSFTDYVKYLESLGQKHKVNLRQYENLFKLVSVLIYEKKINFNVVDKERATLIDVITKKLEKEALTELVNKSLEFKVGKISSAEYYDYLRALAVKHGISMPSEYPNLFNYIIYNSVYSKIENEQLFNDIKKFEEAVKNKIFANDDQRTLDNLSRHINILLGLVNIRLLNGDFDYYKSHRDDFAHEIFAGFIKKMAERYGFAYEVDAPSPAVTESMPKLEDFYSIAIKRDKALVDNTIQAMRKEETQISVLVTGGFHSEGITKILEKQGVSYIVVCPNITKDVETPYIKILTNQRTPLEEILSDTGVTTADAKNVKNGMLAPYLITAARINNIKEMSDRTAADLRAWARMNIAPWLPTAVTDLGKMHISPTPEIIAARFSHDVDAAVEKHIADSKLGKDETKAMRQAAKEIKKLASSIISELLAAGKPESPDELGKIVADIVSLASGKTGLDPLVENIKAGVVNRKGHLEIVKILLEINHEHLFEKWDAPGINDDAKRDFLEQIAGINKDFTGGLTQYSKNVKQHVENWKAKKNPFANQVPLPPKFGIDYTNLNDPAANKRFLKDEEKGLLAAHKTSFVLVAGGLGQRLGYNGIKIDIPVTLATMERYLDVYIRYITAIQRQSNELNHTNDIIPTFIMTSDDTDALTKQVLENRKSFIEYGMVPGQITAGKQPVVPSIMSIEGKFGLSAPYKLAVSPHGHGDIHQVLARNGLYDAWRKEGRTHTIYIQDTNAQQCNVLIGALGNAISEGLSFVSVSSPRKAKQQIGALADMKSPDGSVLFRNIEYNVLENALKTSGQGEDAADPKTGMSQFPGNLNILIMANDAIAEVQDLDKGILEEIFNPKFNPDGGMKPGRPEVMMQDIVVQMQLAARAKGRSIRSGHIMFDTRFNFSPIKFPLNEGLEASKKGLDPASALSAETDYYWGNGERLRLFSDMRVPQYQLVNDPNDALCRIGGPYMDGSMISLASDFALTGKDIAGKVKGGEVSSRSALIVNGAGVKLLNLRLDGALVINAKSGVNLIVKDPKVKNAGWRRVTLTAKELADDQIPQYIRMRGFRLEKTEQLIINIDTPGDYVIENGMLKLSSGKTIAKISNKGTISVAAGSHLSQDSVALAKQRTNGYSGHDYTRPGYNPFTDYGLDKRPQVVEAAERIFTNIIPREKLRTAKVLDCATGKGLLASFAVTHGAAEVVALEASPQMLASAKSALSRIKTSSKIRFVQSDMFDINSSLVNSDGSLEQFDYITVGNVLCFYNESGRREFMKIARRHLKPGGQLIVLDGSRYVAIKGRDNFMKSVSDDYETIMKPYVADLDETGYKNIQMREINREYDSDFGAELSELEVLMNSNIVITAQKKPWPKPSEVSPEKRIIMLISGGESPGVNAYFALMAKKLAPLGYSVEVVRGGIDGLVAGSRDDFMKNKLVWIGEEKAEELLKKPGAFVGTARAKIYDDKNPQNSVNALNNLKGYADTVITIGGNDHMAEGGKLSKAFKEAGIKNVLVLGFSKSIDYDAPGIYMMGADTAGQYVRDLVLRAKAQPGSKKCVIVQAMGRGSGYLTAMAGNIKDPSVIVAVPEWSYDEKTGQLTVSVADVVKAIRARMIKYGAATLVISEGFKVPQATLEEIAADNPILERKLDTLGRDEYGNLKLAELEIGEFIRDALAIELEKIGIIDDNILFENPGYSYRDIGPNALDFAVAEAVTGKAVEAMLKKRQELVKAGGAKITVPRGVRSAEDVRAQIGELPTTRDVVGLRDFAIFTREELSTMGVLGVMDVNASLPDIKDAGSLARKDGYDIDAAATAIMSQSESATALRRFNVCVIARDDSDNIIDAVRAQNRARSSDERWVDARTNEAKIFIKSTDDIDLAGILKKIEDVREKFKAGNLIISAGFSLKPNDTVLSRISAANGVVKSIIENGKRDAHDNIVLGRKLADLLILAMKLEMSMSGIRKNILGESLNKMPKGGMVGAIRGNGGAYTAQEHGTGGALAENIRNENSIVGVIADLILKGDAHSLLPYKKAQKTKDTDKALGQWHSGRLARTSRDNLNRLMTSGWIKDHNIVIVKGLKRQLTLYRIVGDFILEPGIARNSYYIDESDFLYFLSLKNGVELIQKWDTHEMTHIKNPKLSEDVVEVLAPSYDVRLAVLTRGISGYEKAGIEKAYTSLYRDIVDKGKEYTPEEAATEYDVPVGVAMALLDKIAAESDSGKIKKEMYESVLKNTPQAIKDMSMVKVLENGDMVIEFTEENLGDFNEKDNPAGMSILSWFKRYAKEANVSTAGIRGIENILFSQDPRELIGQKAIFFATVAKALVALDLYAGKEMHKMAGSEVRYNSREFVEFIARIQAAFGIKTHIAPSMETVPIWMVSFLIFKYDLLGGEFVTSSHAISKKNATKDLTSEGSQYTPDESRLFIEKIKGMIQTIQRDGVFRLVLSKTSGDLMIDEEFMKGINNGMDDYVKYLKEGVATPENLGLIKRGSRKIYIDVVGGSMYRTMSKIFEMLGIADRFNWLHKKEDPFFHGIGKACYRLNTEKETLAFEDLSCDTSIIVINPKDEVRKIVSLFTGDIKRAIAQKPVGTQILTPVPNSNSKIMGQIRSVNDKAEIERFYAGHVVYIELDAEKVFVIETDKKILPVIRTMGYKKSLSEEKAPAGTVIELTDPDGDRLITAQIVSTGELAALEKLGVAYEILDQDRAIAVFMPNQSFLMTIDFRREMLKRDGKWADKNWFMLKTTASAAAWDDWSAAQIDKSYRIKYAGTGEWKEVRGIPVVNTLVGFKELATVMRKVEKQMRENPEKEVIIEDIFGNQINLGVKPHLLFAGEESGGEVFGSVDMIKSANGREAIAMREKSAGEAIVITSAMASEHESLIKYLEDVYGSIRKTGVNLRQYDYREDVIYFNESEPDPSVRAEAEKEGIKKKEINEAFYLAIAIAIKEEKTTFEKARTFLQSTFPTVDFEKNPANPSLKAIKFVGDGIYLRFADRIIEVRPSGTEAKTKGYALGPDLDILISDAKMLGGYYSEEMVSSLLISPENPGGLLDQATHDRYFKWLDDKQMLQIKAISLDIYNEYLAKGAETKPFIPPSDYGYLSIPEDIETDESTRDRYARPENPAEVGSTVTFDHTVETIMQSSNAGEHARKVAENLFKAEEAGVSTKKHLILVKSAIPSEQLATTTAINYANYCADYYNEMEGYTADMVDNYEDAVKLLAKNPDWDKTNTIVGLIDKQAFDKMTAELEKNGMQDKTKLLPMETFDKGQFIPLKGFFDLMSVLVGVNRPLDRPGDQELKDAIRDLLNEIGVRDVDQLIGALSAAEYFEDPVKFAKNFIIRLLPPTKASNPAELREKYNAAKKVVESL